VFRGPSPLSKDYANHRDAFPDLASRLGPFCSYCERRIATVLAVEHIQPRSRPAYAHLFGCWDNFLLGCVNCNSTKKAKDVVLADVLLPDRDNTAAAYEYTLDGKVAIKAGLTPPQVQLAKNTLALTGLDKHGGNVKDSNEKLVATDRQSQRMEVWLTALSSKNDLHSQPTDAFRRQIVETAFGRGFFSIWMKVFVDDIAIRKFLIEKFSGTAGDCFDPDTTATVTPRPANGLSGGGKM